MSISKNIENIKILVVDDEKDMREFLRISLNGYGFKNTWEAEDGKVAFSLVKHQNFDLIICDWRMPEMDGLELLEAIRKLGNRKDTDFLMVTSVNDAKYVTTAIKSGVSGYITKPVDIDTIYKKIVSIHEKKLEKLAASEPAWMSQR